ncbi:MAG: flagellar protein FlaG, partial [Syntrophales bacterium]
MIEDIQNQLNNMRVDLTFSTYGAEKNICIIVKESKSGKIIREIPPKELQQLAAKLDELNSILFSKSV